MFQRILKFFKKQKLTDTDKCEKIIARLLEKYPEMHREEAERYIIAGGICVKSGVALNTYEKLSLEEYRRLLDAIKQAS